MAKKGDGWLRREMGGEEGIWVAKQGLVTKHGDGWLEQGAGWLSW